MGHLKAVAIPHWDGRYLCSWHLQQMLIFAELSLRCCQLWEGKGRERAGPYSEARSPLEGSLEVVLRHNRGSEGTPCPAPWRVSSSPRWSPEVSREWGLWQTPIPEPVQLPTRLFRSKKSHLWMLSLKKQQHWWVFLAWTEESFCSSYSPHADSAQQLSSSVLFLSQGFLKHHF